jgi:hypothetical protein
MSTYGLNTRVVYALDHNIPPRKHPIHIHENKSGLMLQPHKQVAVIVILYSQQPRVVVRIKSMFWKDSDNQRALFSISLGSKGTYPTASPRLFCGVIEARISARVPTSTPMIENESHISMSKAAFSRDIWMTNDAIPNEFAYVFRISWEGVLYGLMKTSSISFYDDNGSITGQDFNFVRVH